MADTFPASGNIEPDTFPHLLVDLHRHGATGSLKVTGATHPKALYFRGGRILFGSSNDPQDQLGAILIQAGKVTREQLDEVNTKVGPGNPLAKLLAESGFVNQRELADAARAKVERILADVLSWESGSFEFEDGVLPKGAVDLKLSTERLLIFSVLRVADRSFALRHVDLDAVLEPTEAAAAAAEVRADVSPLLERLDGRRSLREAIALTRLDEFEGAKMACAMLFLGLVRKSAGAGPELDLAEEVHSGLAGGARPAFTPRVEAATPATHAEKDEISFGPTGPVVPGGFAFATGAEEPPVRAWEQKAREAPFAAETIALPFVSAEPEVEPVPEPGVAPAREPERIPPPAMPEVPRFSVDRPDRPEIDTVPRDRPVYAPQRQREQPAPVEATPIDEPPPRPAVTPAPTPQASRPSPEDLAALDALLNPSASGRLGRPVERPRPEKWEPQFRPPTTLPRRLPASSGRSRAPLIAAAVGVALATAAAWYFLLRAPASAPSPSPAAATQAPPVTAAAAPSATLPVAATPPGATPAPGATAVTATPAPTAAPTPAPTPRLTPGVPAGAAPAAAGTARELLRQGALPEASRGFAAALSSEARGRFSIQLLTACAPDTVQKAVDAAGADELFILPVNFKGRDCYRLCWGLYDTRAEAEAATRQVPAYFHQGGAPPRVQPLVELLP